MNHDYFEGLIAGLESQGVTRTQIAADTGLSRNTIWRMATGHARSPAHETVERLFGYAEKKLPSVRPLEQKLR